jgi:DNA (cytosine-5)-methyltransferase 1
MRVLDLFSGIGGFSLGLERAGMRTVQFCEIDPYCRAVLAKHWPDVPCFPDIRGIDSYELGRLGGVDVICGGFPCQDISLAGKGAGIAGERSGLWTEYARIIGLVRPRYVIVENVAALLSRGLGTVLGDLAAFGYDAEWHCIPASYVGASQSRDRLWVVAYPKSSETRAAESAICGKGQNQKRSSASPSAGRRHRVGRTDHWGSEPSLCRVANGISANVDALAALGNSVVPQVVEMIGRAIMGYESNTGVSK